MINKFDKVDTIKYSSREFLILIYYADFGSLTVVISLYSRLCTYNSKILCVGKSLLSRLKYYVIHSVSFIVGSFVRSQLYEYLVDI